MPLTINSPVDVSAQIHGVKINSFAVDIDKKEIFVAFSELSNDGLVLSEKTLVIEEPYFSESIQNASATAGGDVYDALKISLYQQIQDQTPILAGIIS